MRASLTRQSLIGAALALAGCGGITGGSGAPRPDGSVVVGLDGASRTDATVEDASGTVDVWTAFVDTGEVVDGDIPDVATIQPPDAGEAGCPAAQPFTLVPCTPTAVCMYDAGGPATCTCAVPLAPPPASSVWVCVAPCPMLPSAGAPCNMAYNQCTYGANTCICANGIILCN